MINKKFRLLISGQIMFLTSFLVLSLITLLFISCGSDNGDDDGNERYIKLEVDWLSNGNDFLKPDAKIIANRIVRAFGDHGYTLEVKVSNAIPHPTGQIALGPSTSQTIAEFWGPDTEFGKLKAANKENGNDWHYCIIALAFYFSDQENVLTASGMSPMPGKDLILGASFYNNNPHHHNQNAMTNILMHELGHNLGLGHGGFERHNFKPNYNSIMNYRFAYTGVDNDCNAWSDGDYLTAGKADYSSGRNIDLDENRIFEPDGVCGNKGVDWSGDGYIDPENYYRGNLDIDFGTNTPYDPNLTVLKDYDDWSNLYLSAGVASSAAIESSKPSENVICNIVHPNADPSRALNNWIGTPSP